jgi:hypothetical protein
LGEARPDGGGQGFPSPAERGFPPVPGPATGPRPAVTGPNRAAGAADRTGGSSTWPAARADQAATGSYRAATGPHRAATGPQAAVTGPNRAATADLGRTAEPRWPDDDGGSDGSPEARRPGGRAEDATRSIPVAGAPPGGWLPRPGTDETRLDGLTSSDVAADAGKARGRRAAAADAAPEAPAKRSRRDTKPPKAPKSKRKTPEQPAASAAAPLQPAAAQAAGLAQAAAPERARTRPETPQPAPPRRAARDAGTAEPAKAGRGSGRPRPGRRTGRRRIRLYAAAGGVVVIAGAAVAFELMQGGGPTGPAHQIVTPKQIGSYVQAPALAASMKASQVRRSIVTQSNGEASNVVAAVYESSGSSPSPSPSPGHGSTAPGSSASSGASAPAPGDAADSQIVLLIGGNLTGTSASDFITSFIGKLPGAVTTAAGPLGGEAACVPSSGGNPAECAWADNDTFGLVASPTLSAQALAGELRQMRVQVEQRTHRP